MTAYERAIGYLAKRSHSRRELALKLARHHEKAEVDEALKRATARGYLDDRQFACQRALQCRLRKGWGDRRITLDLERHGIGPAFIEQALRQAADERSEAEALKLLVHRWVEQNGLPKSLARLKKLHDRCLRLGFAPAEIRQQLSPYFRMMRSAEDPSEEDGQW